MLPVQPFHILSEASTKLVVYGLIFPLDAVSFLIMSRNHIQLIICHS